MDGLIMAKGLKGIMVDVSNEEVYKQRRSGLLKLSPHYKGLTKVVNYYANGKNQKLSVNRLMYACQNNLSYYDLPNHFLILKDYSGKLFVEDRSNYINDKAQANRARRRDGYGAVLENVIIEAEMLKRLYANKDYSEALIYIESKKDTFIRLFMRNYTVSEKIAEECYLIAVERFAGILERKSLITSVSAYIRHAMTDALKKRRKLVDVENFGLGRKL